MSRPNGARILLVEDEATIVRVVRPILEHQGFRVDAAASAREALAAHSAWRPDLILLDLGLPDADGLEVIRRIRESTDTPIVVLSARGAEGDKVAALEEGADDFLTKPFGAAELVARVRVALRHAARPPSGTAAVVRTGELEIDFERRRVTLGGQEVHLTPTEYELLKVLAGNPNKVLTTHQLLQRVWGSGYAAVDHYLHVYATRLRKKIEPDPQAPRYLVTEPGVGYRFLVEDG